ncbi:uncharacterized protein MELLADRAFT_105344 [Melampsora larici-populina 98AG31]|uniref:Man1/Src1-like C-terminal domain-containing protein n=1 Tax=Melampsora larici-populina (strain 98AG31 / pathotype 3-4-7) TaxID=747676 RepID=F4RHT9_MELLP|nr:uncharacterized protein MELLADRAFT_105344 [Melampsora larici-populina 98AG31]EGG07885.1 hypothetical protein MELLADRAFT_105344 [Melampsora larici-populina 98AG31]
MDSILSYGHSPIQRQKLWIKVEKIIEGNSNVRTKVTESRGESFKVWEWIGSYTGDLNLNSSPVGKYSAGSNQKSVGNAKGEPRLQESQLKKTPFLRTGREPSELPQIDYEMLEGSLKMIEWQKRKSYDTILQRKQKNPLSAFLLLHEQRDTTTKPQMALVMTRAEAANVPVYTIGWGKVHSPSCLWQLTNHAGGTYTYDNDLYEIKDTLTGFIGGMRNFNEAKMRDGAAGHDASSPGGGPNSLGFTGTDAFFMNSVGGLKEIGRDGGLGAHDFYDAEFDQPIDALYRDPIAAKTASRLVRPVLLSITIVPPQPLANTRASTGNEQGIVRQRIKLLTSDSLTQALVLVSHRMERQAGCLLEETRHIVHTLLGNIHPGSERPRALHYIYKDSVEGFDCVLKVVKRAAKLTVNREADKDGDEGIEEDDEPVGVDDEALDIGPGAEQEGGRSGAGERLQSEIQDGRERGRIYTNQQENPSQSKQQAVKRSKVATKNPMTIK